MPNLPVVVGRPVAVIRPVLRGDLLDQETDIFGRERTAVVLEGDVRVSVVQVRFDAHADLAVDIHVLGVLDQLPDPTLGCRGRCIHAGAKLRQLLVDLRRDNPVVGLLCEAENCDLNDTGRRPLDRVYRT